MKLGFRHRDLDAVGAHRGNVFGPLIDQDDIEAGIDQIGGNTTAVGAGAEHRDFLRHAFPAAIFFVTFLARDELIRAA